MPEAEREAFLSEAFVKLADTLTADFDVIELMHSLLEETIRIVPLQAGGLLIADENGDLRLVASTSESADFVEMMQLNAGLGPCLDCFKKGSPVAVADLERDGAAWLVFRDAALLRGYRSVFATPLRLRGRIIGTMNLFGTSVGELSSRDKAVAQALADVATIAIISDRNVSASEVIAAQLQRALSSRLLIEQAKGVLSVTGAMSLEEAFATMRAHSRNHNVPLRDVAAAVAERTLDLVSITKVAAGLGAGRL